MYVSSFCKLMRINVFLFSQHGIRAIKEFENTRVRVSPCGQFRKPIQRPCHNPVVLQSSRNLIETKEHCYCGFRRDFPTTSILAEEHSNRSASLRSTFRWRPCRKTTLHALTRTDLRFGAEIHASVRGGACNTVFTRASSRRCAYRRQAHPSTPRATPSSEKPLFFSFSLRPLLLLFSVA